MDQYLNPENTPAGQKPIEMVITMGVQHKTVPHPRLSHELSNPDGYLVIRADNWEDYDAFLEQLVGHSRRPDGTEDATLAYAFDYTLERFEAPGGSAEQYHHLGRLADYTAPAGIGKK